MINQLGSAIYKVLIGVFLVALVGILALPQLFDLNKKEKAESCISNMRDIVTATEKYMRDRDEIFVGTSADLVRTRYIEFPTDECPSGPAGSKYNISVDTETYKVTVTCSNYFKHSKEHKNKFHDHSLHQ
ncbi:MAG: hypothetical protein FWG20_04020 [Candidatus Cloacimonetes bacterium]|nr:hypothetical protein [Candidatus Cloacimonadota bacterium]